MEPTHNQPPAAGAVGQHRAGHIVMPPRVGLPGQTQTVKGQEQMHIPVVLLPGEDERYTTVYAPALETAPQTEHVGTIPPPPGSEPPLMHPALDVSQNAGNQPEAQPLILRPVPPDVQDTLPPSKLVRLLPVQEQSGGPGQGSASVTMQPAGKYRWETQPFRYPAELQAIIKQETQEMMALATRNPTSARPLKKLRRRGRIPELRQVTAVECGAACLAMILTYYGYATSVSEVQERCGVGRDGLTALEIVKAARQYGLRVRAVSINLDDFRYLTLPAIVHWEFNHFLLVERWSRQHVDVIDPAFGRRRLTREEFDEGFTGVAILLEPGAHFERKVPQTMLTPWAYMRSLLHMRKVIFQILGASLFLQVIGLGTPLLTEMLIDRVLPAKDFSMLTLLGLGMLLLLLMQAVATFLRSSLLIYLQTRSDTTMLLNFFEHLFSLPYRFFQLRLNGDLLARVNSNLVIRDLLTNQLLSTLLDGSVVIVYSIILLSISRFIAEVTFVLGILQVMLLLLTSPPLRRLTQRDLEAQGKTQGYLNEVLSGIATLKAAGAEQRAFARWENLFFAEMNIALRLNYLSSVVGILSGVMSLLSSLLLLWVGAMQVLHGVMTIGEMLALNTLAIQLLGPLGSLASTVQDLQTVQAHFSRVADILGAEPEQDPQQVRTPHRLRGAVELRHVSFQYNQNTAMILQDINLKIAPGQKVALVGKTGSGKSTLGKLLVGLITPTQGTILFDGVPLQQMNYQAVRNQLGVVLQESFIFSGSVKENIALNDPEMDMAQIAEAAAVAAIAEDIEKMPMGYDTFVSEGGSAFSGGQRQRLALARALANHPSILLLDEATSALDVVTERVVEQNLRRLPCTQIIIAHRLSTIRCADVILVLERGRIVERGTHEQLLRMRGLYAQLVQAQLQND